LEFKSVAGNRSWQNLTLKTQSPSEVCPCPCDVKGAPKRLHVHCVREWHRKEGGPQVRFSPSGKLRYSGIRGAVGLGYRSPVQAYPSC
jgi:hypothetical protein